MFHIVTRVKSEIGRPPLHLRPHADLAERVKSELFRPADAPKDSVNVSVESGVVYLRGELVFLEFALVRWALEKLRGAPGTKVTLTVIRGNALLLKLIGTASNRDAIGARVVFAGCGGAVSTMSTATVATIDGSGPSTGFACSKIESGTALFTQISPTAMILALSGRNQVRWKAARSALVNCLMTASDGTTSPPGCSP